MHTPGAQVSKCVYPAAKMYTPRAGYVHLQCSKLRVLPTPGVHILKELLEPVHRRLVDTFFRCSTYCLS